MQAEITQVGVSNFLKLGKNLSLDDSQKQRVRVVIMRGLKEVLPQEVIDMMGFEEMTFEELIDTLTESDDE